MDTLGNTGVYAIVAVLIIGCLAYAWGYGMEAIVSLDNRWRSQLSPSGKTKKNQPELSWIRSSILKLLTIGWTGGLVLLGIVGVVAIPQIVL